MPGSYVSVETALSFHGWIPEAVHTITSMIYGGKSLQFTHEVFGQFEFRRVAVKPGYFLHSVTRHELQHQAALIAKPMRALLDLVYLRKLPWQGLDFLLDGLRIDEIDPEIFIQDAVLMDFDDKGPGSTNRGMGRSLARAR